MKTSNPLSLTPILWYVFSKDKRWWTEDSTDIWYFASVDWDGTIYTYKQFSIAEFANTLKLLDLDIKENTYINETQEAFEPTKDLKENISFFSETDLSN